MATSKAMDTSTSSTSPSNTTTGPLGPIRKGIWPALTEQEHRLRQAAQEEQRLKSYTLLKKSLLNWEKRFQSKHGRKPQFCDIEGDDAFVSVWHWKEFSRLHKVFSKPAEVPPTTAPVIPPTSPFMPPEMWNMIFGYLGVNDLKSCQEVSREWANLAWKNISDTSTFCLWRHRLDLQRLENLGNDDRLRPTVKSIRFCSGGFGIIPRPELLRKLLEEDEGDPQDRTIERRTAAEGYEQWCRRKEAAAQNYTSITDLTRTFQRLGHIDDLQIDTSVSPWADGTLDDIWKPDGAEEREALGGPLQTTNEFKAILAVANKMLKLKSLSLGDLPTEFLENADSWLKAEDIHFDHLEKLSLVIDTWYNDEEDPPHTDVFRGLEKLVKTAPNLKELYMEFPYLVNYEPFWIELEADQELPFWRFDFRKHLRGYIWSKLRVFALHGFPVKVKDLLCFLKSHASTLELLELSNLYVDGSIEELLRGIRCCNMTKLRKFHFFGIFDSSALKGYDRSDPRPEIDRIYDDWHLLSTSPGEPTPPAGQDIEAYVLKKIPFLNEEFFNEGRALLFRDDNEPTIAGWVHDSKISVAKKTNDKKKKKKNGGAANQGVADQGVGDQEGESQGVENYDGIGYEAAPPMLWQMDTEFDTSPEALQFDLADLAENPFVERLRNRGR